MITEVKITDLQELTQLVTEQEYRPDLDRHRSSFVYRGMSDASFRMLTSLSRNCKDLQKTLEPSILKNFAKYAVVEDPTIANSVWRQMILGQHYGLPTRLLDWTRSPLVALNFAVTEENLDHMAEHDCAVWRIDVREINALLPEKYQEALKANTAEIFSVDLLHGVAGSLEQYDADMQGSGMVVIEPPSLNARIVNQYGFFSVVPTGMDDIEGFLDRNTDNTVKYVMDKSLRWRVRDMLDQLNVSERIVYPGLDGLTKWIARHYFVKNTQLEKKDDTERD